VREQVPDQGGLADARLTLDPHRPAPPGNQLAQQPVQQTQLVIPSDDHIHPDIWHAPTLRRCPDRSGTDDVPATGRPS
jgi:hypothetical protein